MSGQGLMGKGVPPTAPPFLLYIKCVMLVLTVIILALAAYAISVFGSWGIYVGGYTGVSGLLIFVVIKTWIIYGAFTFLEFKQPHLFFRLAAVVLYSISIVFWLSAWAWSASVASVWLGSYCAGGYCVGGAVDGFGKSEGAALAVCAALGAVVWILSIVHLVFFVRACLADTGDNGVASPNNAELGHVAAKQEATATVYPAGPAPVAGQYYTQQQQQQYQ